MKVSVVGVSMEVSISDIITRTNQNKGYRRHQPVKIQTKNLKKRGKTRLTNSQMVFVLHLIGRKDGVGFLNQSQIDVTQNQGSPEKFDTQLKMTAFAVAKFKQ